MLIAKTVKEKSNPSRPSRELGLSNSGKVSRFWEIDPVLGSRRFGPRVMIRSTNGTFPDKKTSACCILTLSKEQPLDFGYIRE